MAASPTITQYEELYDVAALGDDEILVPEGGVMVAKHLSELAGFETFAGLSDVSGVAGTGFWTKVGGGFSWTAAASIATASALAAEATARAAADALLLPRVAKSGTIADADVTSPADGEVGVDTDTNRLVYRSGGAWYGVTPPQVPDFAVVAAGSIAYALDKTGAVVGRSSTRDSAAVVQACLTALKSAAGNATGTIQLGPQNHDWKTVPKIPMVSTGTTPDRRWLRILGYGAKVTFSVAGAARLFDMDKQADHDQLANTHIAGMVVDAASVASTYSSAHVLIGTEDVSHSTYRVNVDRLVMEDIDVFNVPYDATGAAQRRGVDILVRQAATGEGTMNWVTNVFLRHVRFNPGTAADPLGLTGSGPNRGIYIGAILNDGTALPANVFVDNILIEDCEVNTGHTPTAGENSTDTCIQIGGNGFGGRCVISRFKGSGSNDITIEIDAMTYSLCDQVLSVDHQNAAILWFNFNNPQFPAAQKHVARNCVGRIQNAVATGAPRSLFMIGDSTNQYTQIGEVSIHDCSLYSAQTDAPGIGWLVRWLGSCGLVTIDGLRGIMDQIAATLTGNSAGAALAIYPYGTCEFRPERVKVKCAGAITKSGHTYQLRGMDIEPADVASTDLTVRGTQPSFQFHSTLTGLAAGDTEAVRVGASSTPTHVPTIRGQLPGIVGKLSGDDTNPYGIHVAASTSITIDKELNFRDGDFSGYPSGTTAPNLSSAAPYFGKALACEDQTQARLVKAPGFKIVGNFLADVKSSGQGARDPAATVTFTNWWPIHIMLVFTNPAAALLTDVQITRRPGGNTVDLGSATGPFFIVGPGDDIKFTYGGTSTPGINYSVFPMPF